MYNNWDDAGTARFVKNAAAWLVNWERFNKQKQRPQTLAQQSTLIGDRMQKDDLRTQKLPMKRQEKPSLQNQTSVRQDRLQNKTQKKPGSLRSQGSQWNKD